MPFELGLAVGLSKLSAEGHTWFVFETRPRRLSKSLSDLDGSDPNIHEGTIEGVMRELCNAFVRSRGMPTVPQMMSSYRLLSRQTEQIRTNAGASTLFEARVFSDLCFTARAIADAAERS